MSEADTVSRSGEKIICKIDGGLTHSIELYLKKHHPDWTIARYREEFPGEPILSDKGRQAIEEKRKELAAKAADDKITRKSVATIFGLPSDKAVNKRGEPLMARVYSSADLVDNDDTLVPDIDTNYVFSIENTRAVLMAWELNRTMYVWGLHGTGKTTLFEQVAARTGRPFLRVQHTIGTEESHVLGQYMVRTKMVDEPYIDAEGKEQVRQKPIAVTEFNLGPLPLAMLNGWVYCADEYDAAIPAVSMLYQPVLERKPLYIKDAPPELRMIRPHPNFRFVATGNTNGSGDETGLYQGTQIQNAANYSRFNLTIEADYPDDKVESAIIARQSGIRMSDAAKLVSYANDFRKQFRGGKVSQTISPRELIEAAIIATVRGDDWHYGMQLAFANRLPKVDRQVASELAQRYFGNAS